MAHRLHGSTHLNSVHPSISIESKSVLSLHHGISSISPMPNLALSPARYSTDCRFTRSDPLEPHHSSMHRESSSIGIVCAFRARYGIDATDDMLW